MVTLRQADRPLVVSAKARQLNHRLKNRRNAIVARREGEGAGLTDEEAVSPTIRAGDASLQGNGAERSSVSPTAGFTAVNSRPSITNGQDQPRPSGNGVSYRGASASTRAELLSKFHTSSEQEALAYGNLDRSTSMHNSKDHRLSMGQKSKSKADLDYANLMNLSGANPVAIPNTPSSLLPYTKPTHQDRFDDSGPFKPDMMLRMEQLDRGDRIRPPCDRCRRLHMDCLKNLTACMGCTRKHAKCSWKDVEEQELKDFPLAPRATLDVGGDGTASNGVRSGSEGGDAGKGKNKDWGQNREVRDEELLGESSDEDGPTATVDQAGVAESVRMDLGTPAPLNGNTNPSDTTMARINRVEGPASNGKLPSPTFSKSSMDRSSRAIKASTPSSISRTTSVKPISPMFPGLISSPTGSSDPIKLAGSPTTEVPLPPIPISIGHKDEDAMMNDEPEVRRASNSGMRWDEEKGKMVLNS